VRHLRRAHEAEDLRLVRVEQEPGEQVGRDRGEAGAARDEAERAVEQGVSLARKLKRLPKFADWAEARQSDESLFTEWQVYRMFDAKRGAWSTFQFLVRERLLDGGQKVATDGSLL